MSLFWGLGPSVGVPNVTGTEFGVRLSWLDLALVSYGLFSWTGRFPNVIRGVGRGRGRGRGRGSWVVVRVSWVVGRVDRRSWVVGRGSLVAGRGSWVGSRMLAGVSSVFVFVVCHACGRQLCLIVFGSCC